MLSYNNSNIKNAKLLRKNMTPWERKLWYEFLRQYPVRFQRQKAIDNYIVDFYCAKSRLVIELDGGGHYEDGTQKHDTERTLILSRYHLTVMRICNTDIDRNFYGVCTAIDEAVRKSLPQQRELKSLPQSASQTAPSSEGAGSPINGKPKESPLTS